MSPSFFLFDEPTCGLDAAGIIQFKAMVKNLHKVGTGIVIVSHDGDIIFDLAENIIILERNLPPRIITHKEFFANEDHSQYLSEPDAVTFQKKHFGEIRYFNESRLLSSMNRP
jgi:energy-coupling factor transporter ATP-binding protein EcfA2